jgi:hypothetical protein
METARWKEMKKRNKAEDRIVVIDGEEYRIDKDNFLYNIREEKKIEEMLAQNRMIHGRFDYVSIMTIAVIIQMIAFLITVLTK